MTDITEHPTREGKLPCAAVMDAFSRRIIGWSIDTRQEIALVVNSPDRAIRNRRPEPGVNFRADHGVQFTSWALETRPALLQKYVLNRRRWHTRDELRSEIIYWIEHTCNRRLRQRGLGTIAPFESELTFTPPAAQAAQSHNNRQPNRQQSPPAKKWVFVVRGEPRTPPSSQWLRFQNEIPSPRPQGK